MSELRSAKPGAAALNRALLVGMVLVVSLAAISRFHELGRDSLWNNEILSFERATQESIADSFELIREGTHPPLYPLGVLRPWLRLGDDEFFQRAPSAVFGVLTVLAAFALGAACFGRKAGMVGALLLAISPLHVYYSREGRMYALLALLTTLWVTFLSRALQTSTVRYWLAYSLCAAGSIYSHYYAGLALVSAALASGVMVMKGLTNATLKHWFLANLTIAILFIPWLPTFWHQLNNDPVSHLSQLSATQLLNLPIQFYTVFENTHFGVKALLAMTIAGLGVLGWLGHRRASAPRTSQRRDFALLLAVTLGTVVLAELISMIRPIVYIRYFVGIIPSVCVLLALGLVYARPKWIGAVLYGTLVVCSLYFASIVVTTEWRPDFRSPLVFVERHARPGDQLMLFAPEDDPFRLAPFEHYRPSGVTVTRHYGLNVESIGDVLNNSEQMGGGAWVFQYGQVLPVTAPDGFQLEHEASYSSRFFGGRVSIGLAYLEKQLLPTRCPGYLVF